MVKLSNSLIYSVTKQPLWNDDGCSDVAKWSASAKMQPGSILDRSGSIQKSVRIGDLFPPDLLVSVPISGTI